MLHWSFSLFPQQQAGFFTFVFVCFVPFFLALVTVIIIKYFPLNIGNMRITICDMIKGNESDVGNIDFELHA